MDSINLFLVVNVGLNSQENNILCVRKVKLYH